MAHKSIGTIGNYYGGLHVTKKDGKYYWIIQDWSTELDELDNWEECDKKLYDALIAYENRRNRRKKIEESKNEKVNFNSHNFINRMCERILRHCPRKNPLRD